MSYINREELLAEYDRQHIGEPGRARKLIEDAPSADVVPVKHGKWETVEFCEEDELLFELFNQDNPRRCSECGFSYINFDTKGYNFCPNCGAKMEEK